MAINGSDLNKVNVKEQCLLSFERFLIRHKAELSETKTLHSIDAPYVKNVEILPSGMIGEVIERMEDPGIPDVARILEAYKWDDGVTFSIQMKASDGRSKRYDSDREVSKYSFNYDVPEKKRLIISMLKGLQSRKDNVRPFGKNIAIKFGQVDPTLLGIYETTINYKKPQRNYV
jgi:hypothetical protein